MLTVTASRITSLGRREQARLRLGSRSEFSHLTIFLIRTFHTFTSWEFFANTSYPATSATRKLASLFRNQVASNCSLSLSPAQSRGDGFLPGMEDSLQSPAELFVEVRHLLRQIDQRTTALDVSWPSWYGPNNADQGIDRVLVLAPFERKQPPVAGECCEELFNNGVPQSFLALEMVAERSFGHIGSGQDGIDAGALESRPVDLPITRLQQALPRALWITGSSLPFRAQ